MDKPGLYPPDLEDAFKRWGELNPLMIGMAKEMNSLDMLKSWWVLGYQQGSIDEIRDQTSKMIELARNIKDI